MREDLETLEDGTPIRFRNFHRECGAVIWTGYRWLESSVEVRGAPCYFAAADGGEEIYQCTVCGVSLQTGVFTEMEMWQARDRIWEEHVMQGLHQARGRAGLPGQVAAAMYFDYAIGGSLSEIAAIWGRSRQSVWDMFSGRKLPLRPDSKELSIDAIEWRGRKFAPGKNGYLRATDGERELLHQLVWIEANGPIPDGFNVAFRDGNLRHFDAENLFLERKQETLDRGRNRPGRRVNQFSRAA